MVSLIAYFLNCDWQQCVKSLSIFSCRSDIPIDVSVTLLCCKLDWTKSCPDIRLNISSLCCNLNMTERLSSEWAKCAKKETLISLHVIISNNIIYFIKSAPIKPTSISESLFKLSYIKNFFNTKMYFRHPDDYLRSYVYMQQRFFLLRLSWPLSTVFTEFM